MQKIYFFEGKKIMTKEFSPLRKRKNQSASHLFSFHPTLPFSFSNCVIVKNIDDSFANKFIKMRLSFELHTEVEVVEKKYLLDKKLFPFNESDTLFNFKRMGALC